MLGLCRLKAADRRDGREKRLHLHAQNFAELLAGTAAASSHASALGKKFPAGDLKHLVAAAYATGHMRIAYPGEDPVAKVSIILAVSAKAYRNRLDSGRPPCDGSFGAVVVGFEGR